MTQKPKQDPKQTAKGCAIIIGIVAVGFFSIKSCFFSNEKEQDTKSTFTKQDAVIQSRLCVEKLLKSPGSAKFAYQPDETIDQLNDSTFAVLGYVDSQNDFGALERTYYKCKVIANKKGEAHCKDMQLEEKN
jgi:hypothetical protein